MICKHTELFGKMTVTTRTVPFEARMAAMAEERLGGTLEGLHRLTGGASQELWSFDVLRSDGRVGFVLRRSPGIEIVESLPVVGLEIEAAVITAVGRQGVPVAKVAYVLRPEDELGSGFVAARVGGEALGRRIVSSPTFDAIRPSLASELGVILARIHATPVEELPSLARLTPAESIDLLERQLRAASDPRPVFEAAIHWLRAHCPPPASGRLVHGDFRTGNYMLEPTGISAVLDWEGCHFGDPIEDLGWLCMPTWRFGRNDRPAGGVGTRAALIAAYQDAGGVRVDPVRLRFWEIRGMLRWGMTCLFMADSFLSGGGHPEWAAVGRRASESEIELLHAMSKEAPDV